MKFFLFIISLGISSFFFMLSCLNVVSLKGILQTDADKIGYNAKLKIMPTLKFLKEHAGASTVLVVRQGEFVNYSDINILHTYDKRFANLLEKAHSVDDLLNSFKEKNIFYIVKNTFYDPSFNATFLEKALENRKYTTLVFQDGAYQIYKINELPVPSRELLYERPLYAIKDSSFESVSQAIRNSPSYVLGTNPDALVFPSELGEYEFVITGTLISPETCFVDLKICDFKKGRVRYMRQYLLKKGENIISYRGLYNNIFPYKLRITSQCLTSLEIKNINVAFLKPHKVPIPYAFAEEDGSLIFYSPKTPNILSIQGPKRIKLVHPLFKKGDDIEFDVRGNGVLNLSIKDINEPLLHALYEKYILGLFLLVSLQKTTQKIHLNCKKDGELYLQLAGDKNANADISNIKIYHHKR